MGRGCNGKGHYRKGRNDKWVLWERDVMGGAVVGGYGINPSLTH